MATLSLTLTHSGNYALAGVVSSISSAAPFDLFVHADPYDVGNARLPANGGPLALTGGQRSVIVEFPRGETRTAGVTVTYTPDPPAPSTGGGATDTAKALANVTNPGVLASVRASLLAVAAGTATQGVVIPCVGDSIFDHGAASSYLFTTPPARLQKRLRQRYLPTDKPGGYGFVRFAAGQDADNCVSIDGTGIAANRNTTIGVTNYNVVSGNGHLLCGFGGSGQTDSDNGLAATSVELVYSKYDVGGTIAWDVFTGAATPVTPGTGNVAHGTISTASGTGGPNQVLQRSVLATGLDPSTRYFAQVAFASGNASPVTGMMVRCGDEATPLDAHNLSHGGTVLADYLAGSLWVTYAPTLLSSGAYANGLVVADWLINDVNAGTSAATFRAQLDSFLATVPSGYGVLWTIVPWGPDTSNIALARQLKDALYAWAAANPTRVALLDLWGEITGGAYGNRSTWKGTYPFDWTDDTHFVDGGLDWIGRRQFEVVQGYR